MPKIGSLGVLELLIILVVVLLIFGPRRLPEMAKGLGQSVREFRKGIKDMRKDFEEDSPTAEAPKAAPVSTAAAGAEPATATTDAAGTDAANPDAANRA